MKYFAYFCNLDNQQVKYLFTLKQKNYYEKMEMHSLWLRS